MQNKPEQPKTTKADAPKPNSGKGKTAPTLNIKSASRPHSAPNRALAADAGLQVMSPFRQQVLALLNEIAEQAATPTIDLFKQLILLLQRGAHTPKAANANIGVLIDLLRDYPMLADKLCLYLLTLIARYRQVSLYTDMGILADNSFFAEFYGLIGYRLLPPAPDDKDLVYVFYRLFSSSATRQWIELVDTQNWLRLSLLLHVPDGQESIMNSLRANILRAIIVLAHRISGTGLHREMMEAFPQPADDPQAFIELTYEVREFANAYETSVLAANDAPLPQHPADPSQILVLVEQIERLVQNIRRRIHKTGVTVRGTNRMVRLEQSVERLELLIMLLSERPNAERRALIELMHTLYEGAYRQISVRYLLASNTALLSRKVTDNASKVGEHYISTDKRGYRKMYKKAALGGVLIGIMATIKILGSKLALSLFGTAFMNSMIYGLGFVLIHIIGGTVATKQPAMTAAAIASTISETSGRKATQLAKLAELVVDIMRTQFIAILGNISIAMPLALLISVVWYYGFGTPIIGYGKADHLLHDLNPFTSLAIFHAAIAGVYLYISGLIAGYYDNLAVHNKIGARIRHHPWLNRHLSTIRVEKFASFIEQNLGAIMSNFIFGVCLGSTATIGTILGLPLDIRHIAFASANFSHGLFNIYTNTGVMPDLGLIFVSFLGVVLIGLVNLLVSFSLALLTALRARNVKVFEWKNLLDMVATHFITQPLDFFLPRKEPMKYALIDADGRIIYDDEPVERKAAEQKNKPSAITEAQHTPSSAATSTTADTPAQKLTPLEVEQKKQELKEKAAEKQAAKQAAQQAAEQSGQTKPDTDTASKLPK